MGGQGCVQAAALQVRRAMSDGVGPTAHYELCMHCRPGLPLLQDALAELQVLGDYTAAAAAASGKQ